VTQAPGGRTIPLETVPLAFSKIQQTGS
jgi:hypothetical protein